MSLWSNTARRVLFVSAAMGLITSEEGKLYWVIGNGVTKRALGRYWMRINNKVTEFKTLCVTRPIIA